MRKNIIKTACVTAATALMLGVFATPQTEVFNQTVNTQAKTKKTKYKNGKIKTKTVTKYLSKKLKKKYNLPDRIKAQEYTEYYKNGRVKYKKIIEVIIWKKSKTTSRNIYTTSYKNVKEKYAAVSDSRQRYRVKKNSAKKYKDIRDYRWIYNKKTNKFVKAVYYENKAWTGKKMAKMVFTRSKSNNGSFDFKYYAIKNKKFKKISEKTYRKKYMRAVGYFWSIDTLNINNFKLYW